jgi:hypothetical protein
VTGSGGRVESVNVAVVRTDPWTKLMSGRSGIDTVRVLDRPAHGVTVVDVMAAFTGARALVPVIATAREHLGARGQEWLDRTLAALRR